MKIVSRILVVCMLLMVAIPAFAQEDAVRKQADTAWNEKSYARALELYRKVLATQPDDAEEVEYRIAYSLGATEKWDEAIAAGKALYAKAEGKARVGYWLGRLYTQVEHNGWKIGDKIIRGDDYPKTQSAVQPQRIWLAEEDAQATLKYFEDAKIAAQRDRRQRKFNRYALKPEEEIDLNLDLAAFLPGRELDEFIKALDAGKTFDEKVDVSVPYDTSWYMPKKVLYLYNEIPTLDRSKDKQDSALALLGKGMFVRAYRGRLDQWAPKWDETKKTNVTRPYPFDHLEPVPIWREVVEKYPNNPIAPQTQILIAQTEAQAGNNAKALKEYQVVLDKFPKSKWVNDARMAIQQITRREISIDTMGAQEPGKPAKITVNSRNLKEIRFSAYPIALEKYLTRPEKLSNPDIFFTEFSDNFGTLGALTKQLGAPAAEWTYKTKDKGDYEGVAETIDTPVKELGAYIIVAQAPSIRAGRLLLISDLAILKKVDRSNAFAFIADARSGEPVMGADVVIKEAYYDGSNRRVDSATGKSGEIGFFDKKLVQGTNGYSSNIAVFAYSGKRYAMTGNYSNGYYYGYNREQYKIYGYTDRPVYRPDQKVYFRELITRPVKGGDQEPVKNQKVKILVNNPKGEKVYESELQTNEFGSVSGEFMLPAETPLGMYSVRAALLDGTQEVYSGGSSFRVEEYKRPEFIVSVEAPERAVRPGETVAAKINAKYYFGSPVPGATVKYTVRRRSWWSDYRFPTPYDWLIDYWGVGYDYTGGNRRNIGGDGTGPIVKEGTVKTDAQGNAEITFVATKDEVNEDEYGWWWRRYQNPLYVIEAEVTDASRRTIDGGGSVKVANQQYFAFLNPQRGYFVSGDRVQIEVATQDANDHPVSVSGNMVVYKQLPGDKEEKIFSEPVKTDDKGRLFWEWPSDNAGTFRIAWEGVDEWNQTVIGSTTLWIAGPQLNQTTFRLQGVTIVLDKRYYEEGDTANVLLVADKPDTTVLLTQEAAGDILKRDVIHIEGKSKQVSVPIRHENLPNFAIAAALVKDFQVYQAQQEIFVPPVRSLINVSVKGDKAEYKPGESGTFTIKATDYQGKPVRSEVSVGVIDASLFYIQRDTTPDMRPFFYGDRRAINVQLDSHRSGNPEARLEDDNKYLNLEGHQWELPDEFGQLNQDPSGGLGYWGNYYFGRNEMRRRGARGEMAMMPMAAPAPASPVSSMAMAGAAADMAMEPGAGRAMAKTASRQAADKDDSGNLAPAEVRSNFSETAFWSPAVITENGEAKVTVKFPDSLTQWHATARGITPTAQVGSGEADVETKKNLLVRLQAPRFFTERDQVVLTANVHNYLKTAKRVKVTLGIGDELKLASGGVIEAANGQNMDSLTGTIEVQAGEEKRVNWLVDVAKPGDATIQMTAQTDEESDAVKMDFPVLVHGVQRFAAQSGVLRDGNKATVTVNFPKERRFGSSTLNVQLNPSLAATMLDALPYLSDYPYGCVEQTMSRFLPSVVAAKVLNDSGVNLATLRQRAKAYEAEARAQPIGERVKNTGYTYPTGMPNARDLNEMASHLWYTSRRGDNPIFDQAVLNTMVEEGLNRLYNMQRPDGGWGWWSGSSYSDEYMSAYVVYGLATARAAEVKVRDDVLSRGFDYLQKQMKDEDNLHLLTTMAYSLSLRGQMPGDVRNIVTGRLFEQRERLTAQSKSYLAMALWNLGDKEKAGVVIRNIENTAKIDEANGTARWQMGNQWWYWWNNDVETNAVALRAFLLVDPQNRLVPMMMKWLTTQARGNHWRSTKETAQAVYALADYIRVNKELDVDYTLTVKLGNKMARTYRVTSENALYFDNRFITGDLFLQDGDNTLTIEKNGRGNLYWSVASEYFSLEEPIKASGNEIAIKRRYFKLTRNPEVKPEQPTTDTVATPETQMAPANAPATAATRTRKMAPGFLPRPIPPKPTEPEYNRAELKDGDTLKSGDLVEVELTIDSNNDYEYLVFEDMKAAGLEPQDIRSGGSWGDGLSSNVELRDEKVAFFVDRLPQGTRVLSYRMRAEIPGKFHALPTNGYAMYAPEVRAISDEGRLGVKD